MLTKKLKEVFYYARAFVVWAVMSAAVGAVCGHEGIVGTLFHHLAVLQHQDDIRKPDGGCPLRYDEGGGRVLHTTDGLPQGSIGGIIQGRRTVVKDQNLRLFQSTNNGKAVIPGDRKYQTP